MSYEATLIKHYDEVRKRLGARGQQVAPVVEKRIEQPPMPKWKPRRPPVAMSTRMATRLAIYTVVKEMIGVPRRELQSNSRLRRVIFGRRIACVLGVRFQIADGLKNIARMIGLTDHSSVWHHVTQSKTQCETDPEYAALIERLAHQVSEIVQHREIEQ